VQPGQSVLGEQCEMAAHCADSDELADSFGVLFRIAPMTPTTAPEDISQAGM
jgi:hypothetical protein